MRLPQTPTCCKFGKYQVKTSGKAECKALDSFDNHARSNVTHVAAILALIVILSFAGVVLALRSRDQF